MDETTPTEPINPHLRDILQTALAGATATSETTAHPPNVLVSGHGNVLAWGGSVHIHAMDMTPPGAQ